MQTVSSDERSSSTSVNAHDREPPDITVFDLKYYAKHNHGRENPLRTLGSGDSALLFDVLPPEIETTAFSRLKSEIQWSEMAHKGGPVPRLVSIQGDRIGDSIPIYRHPADEQPALVSWTPTADILRNHISQLLLQPLNHALIQYYRNGNDYISEHSDKTLDVQRGTKIVNLSVGATRVLILRTKDKSGRTRRFVQKITLPHNSLFVLGWGTNRIWTHEIKQDKRPPNEKRDDEKRENGERISLTFRSIATFLKSDGRLYGQGAIHKTDSDLLIQNTTNNNDKIDNNNNNNNNNNKTLDEIETQTNQLIVAFSAENRDPEFDWDLHYGCGFDILNFGILA